MNFLPVSSFFTLETLKYDALYISKDKFENEISNMYWKKLSDI